MSSNVRLLTIALHLAVALCATQSYAQRADLKKFDGYSFEERVPSEWRGGETDLSLSEAHYKWENKSLRWRWQPGQSLLVQEPRGLASAGRSRNGGIKAWIYCEKRIDGAFTFRIGTAEQIRAGDPTPYEFEFKLGYTGWRGFWVHFAEDAVNPAYRGDPRDVKLEAMEVVPPDESGQVFFDLVDFTDEIPWLRTPDDQVPFINSRRIGPDQEGSTRVWINNYYWSTLEPRGETPEQVTRDQKAAFKTISRRYHQWMFGNDIDSEGEVFYKIRGEALDHYIAQAKENYSQLNIRRKDGHITGTPLFPSRSPRRPDFGRDVFEDYMIPLALDWKLNRNERSKQRFFDLVDHVHDQGWAAGSGLTTLEHEELRSAGYMHAIFIMRDELKATGRLQRELEAMRWYTCFNQIYEQPLQPGVSADWMRTYLIYRVMFVLAMEDSPDKVSAMNQLVRWLNQAVAIAPGWMGTIKPDYTGFHHRGIYANAYAPQGFHNAALVYWLLHDTPFAMSDQSRRNIRQVLLTQRIISNTYQVPIGISGRMPFHPGITDQVIPAYAYMALSGDPVDKEMAQAFKRLWKPDESVLRDRLFSNARPSMFYFDTMGSLQLMDRVAEMNISAEPAPTGNWSKPYGALMIHRRDNWMVSLKGWSQYVWQVEQRPTQNAFGRYISYGVMQILANGDPITQEASGYVQAGWDWNRWPGATTIRLPLDQLGSEYDKKRAFTDQTFVGGVSLDHRDGVYVMRLHDTVYEPSFYANKSVFLFDNRVICLGSGITNDDDQHPTETTLFQTHLPDGRTPTWINRLEPMTRVPYDQTFLSSGTVWLMDAVGNGYVVPEADRLHVARRNQQSIHENGRKKTEGRFAVAWLDHGKAPEDGAYEYAVLIQSSPAQVARFAQQKPYQVLRQDNAVHAVKDRATGEIGYAVFDPPRDIDAGPLIQVSRPSVVMLKANDERLDLSVADPDLRFIEPGKDHPTGLKDISDDVLRSPSRPSTVRLSLDGRWKLDNPDHERVQSVRRDGQQTEFSIRCKDGLSVNLTLVPEK